MPKKLKHKDTGDTDTETTQAQSATIQAISGATYTSNGYEQSLQSAIDQAVTAGALAA